MVSRWPPNPVEKASPASLAIPNPPLEITPHKATWTNPLRGILVARIVDGGRFAVCALCFDLHSRDSILRKH